jgi:hypothetical protein
MSSTNEWALARERSGEPANFLRAITPPARRDHIGAGPRRWELHERRGEGRATEPEIAFYLTLQIGSASSGAVQSIFPSRVSTKPSSETVIQ